MTPLDDRNWQPATFAERGVAVPFTSPLLAGARVRLAERRCDLLVPHPGGARGVYIFALASLSEFCAPTLHDSRLAERLAGLRPLSPATVRQAARAVAAEGAAGRAAASTAAAAAQQDSQGRERTELLLLQALIRQSGDDGAAPEQRTAAAVRRLADRTGRDADAVRSDIGLLAGVLAGAGLDGVAPDGAVLRGRCSLLLDTIEAMRADVQSWADSTGAEATSAQLAACAASMRSAGRLVLTAAQKLLNDPAALLGVWATNAEAVTARLCRPDWLLDGWEQLCLLWQVAEDDKAEAAAEACALVPPMPPEAAGWLPQPELLAPLRERHAGPAASPGHASRPASQIVSLVARNERIRALAA